MIIILFRKWDNSPSLSHNCTFCKVHLKYHSIQSPVNYRLIQSPPPFIHPFMTIFHVCTRVHNIIKIIVNILSNQPPQDYVQHSAGQSHLRNHSLPDYVTRQWQDKNAQSTAIITNKCSLVVPLDEYLSRQRRKWVGVHVVVVQVNKHNYNSTHHRNFTAPRHH